MRNSLVVELAPLVAAALGTDPAEESAGNVRIGGPLVRIFDLDDCGYGPPAFDVANALYMVMFDAFTAGSPDTYGQFRESFADGYGEAAGTPFSSSVLDHFIDLRVGALGAWLDDLDSAPIGIRTATAEWHDVLRTFVATHRRTR